MMHYFKIAAPFFLLVLMIVDAIYGSQTATNDVSMLKIIATELVLLAGMLYAMWQPKPPTQN